MPPEAFQDGAFSMPKEYWEQWLKWTSERACGRRRMTSRSKRASRAIAIARRNMTSDPVIDALAEQVGCYRRLAKLAEIQHEHVSTAATEAAAGGAPTAARKCWIRWRRSSR